ASTDNVGVTGYNIYRSMTSGFAPSSSNMIGQTSGTTYMDTSFTVPGAYYYLVAAYDARNNVGLSSNQASAVVSIDTTPPSVSMSAPSDGSSVSGNINLTASASDDVAVAGVQFLLDGASLGTEVTGPGPNYALSWDSTTTGNGPHSLSVRARDGAGNTTTAVSVNVTVTNTAPTGLVAAY